MSIKKRTSSNNKSTVDGETNIQDTLTAVPDTTSTKQKLTKVLENESLPVKKTKNSRDDKLKVEHVEVVDGEENENENKNKNSDSEDSDVDEPVRERKDFHKKEQEQEKEPEQKAEEDSDDEDVEKKFSRPKKYVTEEKKGKKNAKRQNHQAFCDSLNNLPQMLEQFEETYKLLKKLCDGIKNRKITSVKCDKSTNKRQSMNKLHPCIKKYAEEYQLDPEGEYDSFTIVGKIKKYICNDKTLYIPQQKTSNEEGKKDQSLILNSAVDISKSVVLTGTFGELIENMKNSTNQKYRDAANNCKLSNIQTFCSILQSDMREEKKDDKKKGGVKKHVSAQTEENEKKRLLSSLTVE